MEKDADLWHQRADDARQRLEDLASVFDAAAKVQQSLRQLLGPVLEFWKDYKFRNQ